jgi:hypothetical protein
MVKFKSKMVEIDAVRVMVADYNGQTWDGGKLYPCKPFVFERQYEPLP